MMVRITSKWFVAGIVQGGAVAPVIRYMKGWTLSQIRRYCVDRGWTLEVLE